MQTAEYTIGWIAAQYFEQAAATALLHKRFDAPEDFEQNASDGNDYVWGRMRRHNVVTNRMPTGDSGTSDAATTALLMRASLPQIRVGLPVGIGSGIPGPAHVIRLGDVIVSVPEGQPGLHSIARGLFEECDCILLLQTNVILRLPHSRYPSFHLLIHLGHVHGKPLGKNHTRSFPASQPLGPNDRQFNDPST